MKAKILQRLSEIESKYDVKVLLAVESGSRAWGFASKDSDYDVRFVYIHRKEWYLSLIEGRDVIEELDPDGVLDLAGWDLKKALILLGKGNCAFAEWLNSPTVYYKDEAFMVGMNEIKNDYFRQISAVNHYYHMAMNHDKRYLEKRGCEMKRFMYHLRGLLAAKCAAIHGSYPPVLFEELVEKMISDDQIKQEIYKLVELKRESREHNTTIVNDDLICFVNKTAEEIESMLGTFPSEKSQDFEKLDNFFLNILNTFNI